LGHFPTADKLAAAAGLAPVLKQSGKVRYLKRAHGGNKTLKRVVFQSAFCSLSHPDSKAFYRGKRDERKPTTGPSSPSPADASTFSTPSCATAPPTSSDTKAAWTNALGSLTSRRLALDAMQRQQRRRPRARSKPRSIVARCCSSAPI
jgi:Transposase IS116/IS110/IS902 family